MNANYKKLTLTTPDLPTNEITKIVTQTGVVDEFPETPISKLTLIIRPAQKIKTITIGEYKKIRYYNSPNEKTLTYLLVETPLIKSNPIFKVRTVNIYSGWISQYEENGGMTIPDTVQPSTTYTNTFGILEVYTDGRIVITYAPTRQSYTTHSNCFHTSLSKQELHGATFMTLGILNPGDTFSILSIKVAINKPSQGTITYQLNMNIFKL